jgi:phosphatidate phosphatase APP1
LLDLAVPVGVSAGQFLSQYSAPITLRVSVSPELTPVKICQATKIPWAGWSVISDIDDTIKDTQISPLRQLLTNTFLREFRGVAGMAELYRGWADLGCQFHYVSSSPWQLLDPLQQLCQEEQFPAGTFHLRTFRLGTDLVRKMLLRQRGKAIVIQSLLATFPQRKFVLVGDSGERDPEIYCRAAKRFPNQVKAIYIRDVVARRITRQRLEKITESLPAGLCQAFSDASELSDMAKNLLWE